MRRVRPLPLIACTVLVLGILAGWVAWPGPPPLGRGLEFSTVVVDREGRLLRPFTTREGRWRLPVRLDEVDPRYLTALIHYEDKRFWSHRGIDPIALARAALQFVRHGHIVSGGSTISMQVARLLEPRAERSVRAKLRQIVRAVQLELALTKTDILALYLNLAPYGGNLEGVRAAALAYFGKEPRRLTLGEAAMLIALPQSPEARRPDRSVETARRARDHVLDRLAAKGVLSVEEVVHAKSEPVPGARRPMPMLAPHAAEQAVAAQPEARLHRLTIDARWQKSLEDLARDRALFLGPDVSIAIMAVDHATGEVLAHVGAADYLDPRRAGHLDMTQALRSPGSLLKPFIYGLGFEDGFIHPETLIEDRPLRFGAYAPENFDLTFQGTVTVRQALQLSLNIPAVAVLEKVGPHRLATRLAQAGATLALPKGEAPGLAIGLGGVGIRLRDLVRLYTGLPRLGSTVRLVLQRSEAAEPGASDRLMEPVAAWYVGHVLRGTPPPENAGAHRIAFKTGTSYGYRDAWAIGFDGRVTIGVWVGRPDGTPVPGLTGRTAAAPILFDAFARSGKALAPFPRPPRGVLFVANAKLPLPLQRYRPEGLAGDATSRPPKILFPPNGARLELARHGGRSADPIALKIAGGQQPLTILVNGIPLTTAASGRTFFFVPEGPGFTRLTVMDAQGASDSVLIRLQ